MTAPSAVQEGEGELPESSELDAVEEEPEESKATENKAAQVIEKGAAPMKRGWYDIKGKLNRADWYRNQRKSVKLDKASVSFTNPDQ